MSYFGRARGYVNLETGCVGGCQAGGRDERGLDPGLPDELYHITERAGRHRSDLLRHIDVDEDRHSLAHHEPGERPLFAGFIDTGALPAGDNSLCGIAAGALNPPLSD